MSENENVQVDEDLVNKWRVAQGDLRVALNARGKISHAIPLQLTIIKDLIRRGIFPYHYEIYGVGFLELQSAFRTPMKAKCSAVLLEQWGVGPSSGNAAGIYLNVCKMLGNVRVKKIEFLLENGERRKNFGAVWNGKERRKEDSLNEFAKHFERLIEIMDGSKFNPPE